GFVVFQFPLHSRMVAVKKALVLDYDNQVQDAKARAFAEQSPSAVERLRFLEQELAAAQDLPVWPSSRFVGLTATVVGLASTLVPQAAHSLIGLLSPK